MRCLWQSKRGCFEDGPRLAGRTAPADRNGPTVSKCGPVGGPCGDRASECRDGGISGGEITYPANKQRRGAPCLPGTPERRRRRETAEAPPAAEKARLFRGCGPVGGPCGDRAPECRDGGISGGEITYPANKQRRAAPCLPGTPGWRRRRWRYGSSDRQSPAGPRRPRCRRRPRW